MMATEKAPGAELKQVKLVPFKVIDPFSTVTLPKAASKFTSTSQEPPWSAIR